MLATAFVLSRFCVSAQRKPEEASPVKDTEAKQAKREAAINGGANSSNGNGVQEEQAQEASDRLYVSNAQNVRLIWVTT